jgi:putative heme iron utilization protein
MTDNIQELHKTFLALLERGSVEKNGRRVLTTTASAALAAAIITTVPGCTFTTEPPRTIHIKYTPANFDNVGPLETRLEEGPKSWIISSCNPETDTTKMEEVD